MPYRAYASKAVQALY